LTHAIIGAAMEVHREMGPGFLESIYRKALLHELHLRNILARSESEVEVAVVVASFPLLEKEGWPRHQKDSAKPPL
jgi:GxxExxY protein